MLKGKKFDAFTLHGLPVFYIHTPLYILYII